MDSDSEKVKTESPAPPKKFLDQVRDAIRLKHLSYRTEETCAQWIRRYIFFHGKRHPKEMGGAEVKAFLEHLAVERRVSTTMIAANGCGVSSDSAYTHVLNKGGLGVKSPLDAA